MYQQNTDGFSPMKLAAKLLFIPDLLNYMLTGNMVTEYTVASTSSLLNPFSRNFDDELLVAAGVRKEMFPKIVMSCSTCPNPEFRIFKQWDLESDGNRDRNADNMQ